MCTDHFQSDNFNNIMSSFELDPSNPQSAEAMARGDPVDAFLKVGFGQFIFRHAHPG